MAFDGITTKAVITELQNKIIGGKVNKIFEPTKNEILLNIYNKENYTLILSSNPDYCRINLTSHTKPNPQNAPNFCMLLRKYLVGGKIIDISNYDLERTVEIKFECYNELNDLVVRKLFIQIMSRQSNIALTNDNNIIIDSLKHFENSLPANPFEFAKITKTSFLDLKNFEEFFKLIDNSKPLLKILPNTFIGFSKTFIKQVLLTQNIPNENYTHSDLEKLYLYIKSIIENLGTNSISLEIKDNDYWISLKYTDNTINQQIDEFYFEREQKSIFISSRNNLLKIVSENLKKIYKKIENINIKLKECDNMDTYRIYGELLTANLYKLNSRENLSEITLENYYNDNQPIIIPLDNKINIQKNIEKYFKKYNKLKNALIIVGEQKKEAEKEIDYIESIVFSLENAKTLDDIADVYSEISENIITKKEVFKKNKNKISKKKTAEKEIVLQSQNIDGFTVYIGKNNLQNDYLSLKFANKNDIWFHTQKIHGSHILLRNPENEEIPESILYKCAELAKENSKGKLSSNVPVDYCLAKFVKKAIGSKPGLVIYTNYKTIFVK